MARTRKPPAAPVEGPDADWIHQDVDVVALDQLVHLEGNPNQGDVKAVARSFARFGQRKQVTVRRLDDGRGEITAGNTSYDAVALLHRLAVAIDAAPHDAARQQAINDAMELLGSESTAALVDLVETVGSAAWSKVMVVWIDEEPDEAKAWALTDNRTSRLGHDDPRLQLQMLRDIEAADAALLEVTGFEPDDLKDLEREVRDLDRLLAPADVLPALDPEPGAAPAPAAGPSDTGGLARPSLTPNERRDAYEASSIRSIVLPLNLSQYAWVTAHLAALRREMGVESNADVIIALVEQRVGGTAPRDAPAVAAVVEDDE